MEFAICHYEDEVGTVDLPELIERGLYVPGVSNSSINFENNRKKYIINYGIGKNKITIYYLIYIDIPTMKVALEECGNPDILLSIVDLSIHGDRTAGAKIVVPLVNEGVPQSRIWMLTGYSTEALQILAQADLKGIRVISKPSSQRVLREEILDILEIETGQTFGA